MIRFLRNLLWVDLKIERADIKIFASFTVIVGAILILGGYLLNLLNESILLTMFLFAMYAGFYHLHGLNKNAIYDVQQKNQTLFSIYNTINPTVPLPLMTGWAAQPELIYTIIREISFEEPKTIFEIGSGSSTIISSLFLKNKNIGKITSIDHDEKYFSHNLSELQTYGVSDIVDLNHCPLIEQNIGEKKYIWYDLSNVDIPKSIDMLVIDGPPFKTSKHVRYPALPLLYDYLSDNAIIILDDANRKDESEIIELWIKLYPNLKLKFIDSDKGVAILKKS